MDEPTLFGDDRGKQLRDDALARVEAHAVPDWMTAARNALITVAGQYPYFTSDRIRDELAKGEATTHEPRAMGPVMLWGKTERIIEPTPNFDPTTRPQGHAGPRRIWRSLII